MFNTVHAARIFLADGEWSSSGIMDKLAKEWLDAHKALIKDGNHIAVTIHEHGGWSLTYSLDSKGELMVVGSANDAAQWHGEKKAWRENAYNAKWDYEPEVRREAVLIDEVWEVGHTVLSHQKKGDAHRLIICCDPPQKVGEWIHRTEPARIDEFSATWDEVTCGKRVS